MCGSLASIGLPDRLRAAATTQLLLPPMGSTAAEEPPCPANARTPAASPSRAISNGQSGAGCAVDSPGATIVSSSCSRVAAMNAS